MLWIRTLSDLFWQRCTYTRNEVTWPYISPGCLLFWLCTRHGSIHLNKFSLFQHEARVLLILDWVNHSVWILSLDAENFPVNPWWDSDSTYWVAIGCVALCAQLCKNGPSGFDNLTSTPFHPSNCSCPTILAGTDHLSKCIDFAIKHSLVVNGASTNKENR